MKYLHFMMDQFYSREFIKLIQSNFKIEEHQFFIVKKKNKKMYINPKNYQNVKIFKVSREKKVLEFVISHIKFFTFEYIKIRRLMKQADYIFVHNLTEEISGILFGFKGKAKILWVIWGSDLYDYVPLNLYDHYTSRLLTKLDKKVISGLINFYYSFFFEIKKAVIRRLDYVISAHSGDLKLFNKFFKTKAECYTQSIYPNPVDFEKLDAEYNYSIDERYNYKKNGFKLLLLGNSGSPTNNHLDIMIRLSEMKEQDFKIICPLSYGPPIYIKKIIENGKILFGDRFIPLLEFLNPEIYYHILKQVDLAIMYHNRQQGMGNIQILVYLGKPICMKKTSAFFHLIERGVFVFSTQDLEKLILNEMEFTEVMLRNNKKIAREYFSVKSVISSIENLVNLLEEGESQS
ncbi:hypothetical protein LCGC14_0940580 [marine sediment metagenome]|uniref:Glycosyltransferase subfamily 4-like N-terminal domain-containing protein n=1 Tax=marine sediment metagenome TaxID=412755 RepID=A0A0F9NK56_9ZZZZ